MEKSTTRRSFSKNWVAILTLVVGRDTEVAQGILERRGSRIFQSILEAPKVSSMFGVGRPSVPSVILSSVITCHCVPLLCFPGYFIFFFFNIYSFFRDRDRARTGEGQREREREREGDTESKVGSRLWAVSTEPNTGLKLTNHEIMTWAEVGRLTNWATQAPIGDFVFDYQILPRYWAPCFYMLLLPSHSLFGLLSEATKTLVSPALRSGMIGCQSLNFGS